MANKYEFQPFDYVLGKSFRALLSQAYFSLIQDLREKVSADHFAFTMEVGNFFYRAGKPEREILVSMVSASGLADSECLTLDENKRVHLVQTILNNQAVVVTDKDQLLLNEAKEIATGIAVVYFKTINDYCYRNDIDRLNWDEKRTRLFFEKWYAFSEATDSSKYLYQFYKLLESLALQEGYDNPKSDLHRDVYDIVAPNEKVANEIVAIARLAGFYFGMTEEWTGFLKVPTHFRLKSFAWHRPKLLHFVQLIAWHYPETKINVIFPSKENMRGYYWYRDRLHVSEKLRIHARMEIKELLKADNFTDPWTRLKSLAHCD